MADLNLISTPVFNSDGLSLSASRNPIQFKFETDVIGSPNYAYTWIHVVGPTIVAGTEIEFNGTTYTASDDPAFGQFLTTTAHTRTEVAQSITLMLRDDPNNYEYEVQTITQGFLVPMVFITAKQPGTAYNISITVGAGFFLLGNLSGSDEYRGQSLEGYKVWAELYTNDAFAFAQYLNAVPSFSPGNRLLAYFDLKFDAANEMTFDVHGLCDSEVDYQPPSTAIGIYRQDAPLKAFFVEYGESFTPAGMENELRNVKGRSNVFYAANGALGTLAPNNLTDYTKRQPLQKFLTDQPVTRSIRTTDISWLTFIHYSPNAQQRWIGAFIQAIFYDDSTAVVGTLFKTQMSNGYHTMRIDPLSWGMANYEQSQGMLVKRYDVYLVESLNAAFTGAYKFSELRSFVIDRLCPSDGMLEFAWLETIGGWAGFTFFGELLTDIDRSPRTFDRGRAVDYTPYDQMATVQQVDFAFINTAHSGVVDETTYQWLRDSLLKSAAVYIVAGGQLVPIVVTAHSAKSGTEDFTYQLAITFRLSAPINVLGS
jgi:hypothetical protein